MITTIDNHGERLVPGESHNSAETIRHKSSYQFFKSIILADAVAKPRILDLGCGVGHGSLTLSEIPNAQVIGIDASDDAIDYARSNYGSDNIVFLALSAEEYLSRGEVFDYIVSRHALEHIQNGIQLARRFNFTRRLLVNVPYMEPAVDEEQHETNPHHELNDISEKDFEGYLNSQFFFEDMQGITSISPEGANSIICASRTDETMPVSLPTPFAAWSPSSKLEALALSTRDFISSLQDRIESDQHRLQEQESELRVLREAHEKLQAEHAGLLASGSVKSALAISRLFARWR